VQGNDGDGEDGNEGGLEGIAEEQLGERKCKKVTDPIEPSEKEVAEHALTHLPFRNWCRFCCRGRGVEMAHRKTKGGEGVAGGALRLLLLGG